MWMFLYKGRKGKTLHQLILCVIASNCIIWSAKCTANGCKINRPFMTGRSTNKRGTLGSNWSIRYLKRKTHSKHQSIRLIQYIMKACSFINTANSRGYTICKHQSELHNMESLCHDEHHLELHDERLVMMIQCNVSEHLTVCQMKWQEGKVISWNKTRRH
jgi:hypothetical protein